MATKQKKRPRRRIQPVQFQPMGFPTDGGAALPTTQQNLNSGTIRMPFLRDQFLQRAQLPQRPDVLPEEIDAMDVEYGRRHGGAMASGAGTDAFGLPSRDPRDSLAMWQAIATNRQTNDTFEADRQAAIESGQRTMAGMGVDSGRTQTATAGAAGTPLFGGTLPGLPGESREFPSGDQRILNLTTEGRQILRNAGVQTLDEEGAEILAQAEDARQKKLRDRRWTERLAGADPVGDARRTRQDKELAAARERNALNYYKAQGIAATKASLPALQALEQSLFMTPQQEASVFPPLAQRTLAEERVQTDPLRNFALAMSGGNVLPESIPGLAEQFFPEVAPQLTGNKDVDDVVLQLPSGEQAAFINDLRLMAAGDRDARTRVMATLRLHNLDATPDSSLMKAATKPTLFGAMRSGFHQGLQGLRSFSDDLQSRITGSSLP